MSSSQPLPVNTASAERSIWKETNQNDFRKHIVDLQQACNKTPGDPKVHVHRDWHGRRPPNNDNGRVLPFEVEERLSNDLAFLVANQQDAQTVSAVALEESLDPSGLIVRLAANGAVQQSVVDALRVMFSILEKCAKRRVLQQSKGSTGLQSAYILPGLHRTACRDLIFDQVIALNRDRINGRLQSSHWTVPTYLWGAQREPLDQSLQAFFQSAVKNARTVGTEKLQRDLNGLYSTYQSVNSGIKDTNEELQLIKAAVKQSHGFCTPDDLTIEEAIANYGLDPGTSLHIVRNKHVRQVDKIGRYWGLCRDMVSASRRYSELFKSIRLKIVPRYAAIRPPAVRPNKDVDCHVHAEIQLVTFYDLNFAVVQMTPRVLGVSKAACYLCDLFIFHHKHFFISKTHGRLYHQWNVPDLKQFGQRQLLEYRHILATMNDQLQTSLATERRNQRKRGYPLESWQALGSGFPTSPLPSSVGTLLSGIRSPIASAVTSSTVTPRARPIDAPRLGEHEADNPGIHDALDALDLEARSLSTLPAIGNSSSVQKPDLVSHYHAATPTQTVETSSSSASSNASSELPVQRDFTAGSPIRSRIGNVSFTFETEGATRGSVAIARILNTKNLTAASSVDIDALKPGDVKEFARELESETLVLSLHHSQGQSTQITLRWLQIPRSDSSPAT